jgi:hypothetical protein
MRARTTGSKLFWRVLTWQPRFDRKLARLVGLFRRRVCRYICELPGNILLDLLSTPYSYLQCPLSWTSTLCLYLMSNHASYRDQAWRDETRARPPIWYASFDRVRSRIPATELGRNALSIEHAGSQYASSEQTTSEYLPSALPVEPPVAKGRRVANRFSSGCAPSLVNCT